MFTLMVSYNCGISYQNVMDSEDIEVLRKQGLKLDDEWLRWYIEENGKPLPLECKIHTGILSFISMLNSKKE